MSQEREPQQNRVKLEVIPAMADCYAGAWGDDFMRRIEGVSVQVTLDNNVVWEKTEYSRFASMFLLYAHKPFFDARIQKARKKAERIATILRTATQTS